MGRFTIGIVALLGALGVGLLAAWLALVALLELARLLRALTG